MSNDQTTIYDVRCHSCDYQGTEYGPYLAYVDTLGYDLNIDKPCPNCGTTPLYSPPGVYRRDQVTGHMNKD